MHSGMLPQSPTLQAKIRWQTFPRGDAPKGAGDQRPEGRKEISMAVLVLDQQKKPLTRVPKNGRGDLVKAVVPTANQTDTHVGRATVGTRGRFNIQGGHGLIQGVSHRFGTRIQRVDGYGHALTKIAFEKGEAERRPAALPLPGLTRPWRSPRTPGVSRATR